MPTEPGLGSIHLGVSSSGTLSVWPKPSWISTPVCALNWRNTSGLSGSPAAVAQRRADRSYLSMSSLMM